jgi:hypothetical protein
MTSPDDQLQKYFNDLPGRVHAKLAGKISEQADKLADAIQDAAAEGPTGHLKESVRVEDGRDDLEKIVKAGGPLTTTELRGGSGVGYDHALGIEFGTSKMPAQPFFYPTARALADDIHDEIEDAVTEALQ